MPLHELTDDERRSLCRREIEALEHWLRRLVHGTLFAAYGAEYLDAVGEDCTRLFRKETIETIEARRSEEPSRYARPIDAATLDDLVRVICKRENYKQHFEDALRAAFPEGAMEARTFLCRVVAIRNKLSHANPISVHEALRAMCYTQDVIASLKEHYAAMNQQTEYNVPMIIRVSDSLGHAGEVSGSRYGGQIHCYFHKEISARLYPGDRLSIDVEVDPTFERSSYRLEWRWHDIKNNHLGDTEHVVIDIDNSHII
jgi:hypothetical protein